MTALREHSLTLNWIAESNIVHSDCRYFKELCHDCIVGMRAGETVYCFSEEQLRLIIEKAPFEIEYVITENYYALTRVRRDNS